MSKLKDKRLKLLAEMKEPGAVRAVLTILIFAVIITVFLFGGILKKKADFSEAERRPLKKWPKLQGETLVSGKFMDDFEAAALDQFPLRDAFRSVKAYASKYVYFSMDNHGIYQKDGYLSKLEYPENSSRVQANLSTIRKIYESQIEGTDCKVYVSLIPDKNKFLTENSLYPAMDYDAFLQEVQTETDFAEFIDISDLMSLEVFYKTDQHWAQERIVPIASCLLEEMCTSANLEFEENEFGTPFYGTYASQSALHVNPDVIKYLTSDEINQAKVFSYSTGQAKEVSMYDLKKSAGRDPYELFLLGSEPLLVIENEMAETDKELVIFRDSFGSSLAPLLTPGYQKITVVDLRYMNATLLPQFVEFKDQDVLFMYSTLILNNSISQ